MKNDASSVLFRRLPYMLSPQLDIYEKLGPFVRKKNVLEVGFGTGIGVLQYANEAIHVSAIEIDPAAVRFAQRCFPIRGVAWRIGNITQLTGDGHYYDFIVMIEVLEHISEPEKAIDRIKAFLGPRSHALITAPNKLRDRRKDDPLTLYEWDAHSFYALLSSHFDKVRFLDFELRELNGIYDSKSTPLITLCS